MITFELVSPEKKLFSAEVGMATLPGMEGDFGVMQGHAPFISSMRVGVIDIYENGKDVSRRILVSGGMVEVNPQHCTVLAEDATPLEDVSVESLSEALGKLRERHAVAEGDAKEKLEDEITLTEKKLEVLRLLRGGH